MILAVHEWISELHAPARVAALRASMALAACFVVAGCARYTEAESGTWRVRVAAASIVEKKTDSPKLRPELPIAPLTRTFIEVPLTVTYLGQDSSVVPPKIMLQVNSAGTALPLEVAQFSGTFSDVEAGFVAQALFGGDPKGGPVTLKNGQRFAVTLDFEWLESGAPMGAALVFGDVAPITVGVDARSAVGLGSKSESSTPKAFVLSPPAGSFRAENVQSDSGSVIVIAHVTAGYFGTLAIQPHVGRGFVVEEYDTAAPVALLSHAYWSSRFQADPSVVARPLRLGEKQFTIVGVMPSGADTPRGVAAWVPGR